MIALFCSKKTELPSFFPNRKLESPFIAYADLECIM